MIDLHTHSNKSDGSFTPAELIDLAVQKGITYIALTDHDSIEGIDEAKRRAEEISSSSDTKISVIPGIEFSTDWNGRDVHVVGLNIDHTNKEFVGKLDFFLDSREGRNRKMAENLRNVGIGISYDALLKSFPLSVSARRGLSRS